MQNLSKQYQSIVLSYYDNTGMDAQGELFWRTKKRLKTLITGLAIHTSTQSAITLIIPDNSCQPMPPLIQLLL